MATLLTNNKKGESMNFNNIKATITARKLSAQTECINGNLSVTGYDSDRNLIVTVNAEKVQVKGKVFAPTVDLSEALDHYKTRGIIR